jgi:hypothetical protein
LFKKLEIDGIKKEYLLYDDGRLYDVQLQRFKNPMENQKGYLRYSIYVYGKRKFFFVHRLVLSVFNPIENMENLQVNHIDGNKKNNRLENLEWCTQSENQIHAFSHGLISRKGEKNSQCKLSEKDVFEIINMLRRKEPYNLIAKKFNISKNTVAAIRSKRLWKHITKYIKF